MKLALVVLALMLAGCEPHAEVKNYPVVPEELKDCKFFYIVDGNGSSITVARCPNSSTTVQMGNKARTTSVIVDGKEYVAK